MLRNSNRQTIFDLSTSQSPQEYLKDSLWHLEYLGTAKKEKALFQTLITVFDAICSTLSASYPCTSLSTDYDDRESIPRSTRLDRLRGIPHLHGPLLTFNALRRSR